MSAATNTIASNNGSPGQSNRSSGIAVPASIYAGRRALEVVTSLALIAGIGLIPADYISAQTITTLHGFTATATNASGFYTNSDGANPYAGLVAADKSKMRYGTAANGGSAGYGTVFAINTDGTGFKVLHSFTGDDGANPWAGLICSDHTLYGSTIHGGLSDDEDSGDGTLFAINTDGTGFRVLHTFSSGSDGAYPNAGLILSGNTLYGTASQGGTLGQGTVFSVNTDGTGFTTLYSFSGSSDGGDPVAGLVLSSNTLYGTTAYGGSSVYDSGSGEGTVFAINRDGTGFTVLHMFEGTQLAGCSGNWDCPPGYRCVSGGRFRPNYCQYVGIIGGCSYCSFPSRCVGGICFGGCSGFCFGGGAAPPTPNAAQFGLTFVNSDGANPNAGLVLSSNTLYGTAAAAGHWGNGTVFALNTDGTGFRVLHNFLGGSDGASPWAALILSGTNLYGTAYAGGGGNGGTVFGLNLDGTGFTNLCSFTHGSDGASPIGGLFLSGNTLYGTAELGGDSGQGTVFSVALPPLPPVAQCKNVTVSAGANCAADASIDDGSYSPNDGDTITLAQSPAGPYPLGDTSLTLTVTDIHGLSNSCVATVTVVDTTPPLITCPGNIVADATSPAGTVVSFVVTASDNCSLAGVTSSPSSGSTFATGDTTVACIASDAAGNQANCSFTVHVRGAAEQIHDLIAQVQSPGLPAGTATSLVAKLHAAAGALDRGNSQAACGHLGAFLNEVNAQRGKKLMAAQADRLIDSTIRIRAVLACR